MNALVTNTSQYTLFDSRLSLSPPPRPHLRKLDSIGIDLRTKTAKRKTKLTFNIFGDVCYAYTRGSCFSVRLQERGYRAMRDDGRYTARTWQ